MSSLGSNLHVQDEDLAGSPAEPFPSRGVRLSPEAATDAWRALCERRWEIVKREERNGRRFVVVRPGATMSAESLHTSVPPADGFRPEQLTLLSPQERRMLIELANGYSNKLIAYDLGLATSTVASVLARAARKLGATNRIALARAGRALAEHPAGELDAG